MPARKLESVGWSRLDYSEMALEEVARWLSEQGWTIEDYEVGSLQPKFRRYTELSHYQSEYRAYGGAAEHCFLEKALEHLVSFELVGPKLGDRAVDIGSCLSVVPYVLLDEYGTLCLAQDLVYPAGVHGNKVGSSADALPLEDGSVDFMTLHCTFEHFESGADTGFVGEVARTLRPGGRVAILPLYLNPHHVNISGEAANVWPQIGFDAEAQHYCHLPEWRNRFGRHYSPEAVQRRVLAPARQAGLGVRLLRVRGWGAIHPELWLRWILLLEKPLGEFGAPGRPAA